jgi:CPA1 family monovalent cation:H+ antiporter
MLKEQVISQEVFNDLVRNLDRQARALDRQPRLDLGMEPEKLLCKVPFFTDLGTDRIKEIAKLLTPQLVIPGERVVRKGESGDALYFISSGALTVSVTPEPVQLGSGDFFGEVALLTQEPRNADVTALAYCRLLKLRVGDFHQLLAAHPDLRDSINRVAGERLDPKALVAKLPLFARLSSDQIANIAKRLKPELVAPGEQVVSKGETGDAMYFIATGLIEVIVEPAPVRLCSGDFFGEVALLTQAPRNADVRAITYSQLLKLQVRDFHQLLDADQSLKDNISQVARKRLK